MKIIRLRQLFQNKGQQNLFSFWAKQIRLEYNQTDDKAFCKLCKSMNNNSNDNVSIIILKDFNNKKAD